MKKIVDLCDWLEEKTHFFYFGLFIFDVAILPAIILVEIYRP